MAEDILGKVDVAVTLKRPSRRGQAIPISIAMPPEMARGLRVLAAQQDKSRSQLVREILEQVLGCIDIPKGAA